jgi:hypothetical protein
MSLGLRAPIAKEQQPFFATVPGTIRQVLYGDAFLYFQKQEFAAHFICLAQPWRRV